MYTYANKCIQQRTGEIAICHIPRCHHVNSEPWNPLVDEMDLDLYNNKDLQTQTQELIALGLPPFDQKRVIIWYQKDCVACQNNSKVFDAVAKAGITSNPPFTVHLKEATPDMIKRFPHIFVVPMFDVVEPAISGTPVGGPYGDGTILTTIRNDINALRVAFPNLSL